MKKHNINKYAWCLGTVSSQNITTAQTTDSENVTIKGSNGTVYVQGDSAYTVTVDSYTA